MQDLSVLVDENGHRIMGACPPEQTTTLQLIRSLIRYARAHRSELPGNVAVVCEAKKGSKPREASAWFNSRAVFRPPLVQLPPRRRAVNWHGKLNHWPAKA